jgi:hypothetical protein
VYEEEYAIFTEFQGRRGSDALVAAIPFSETSSSHRGQIGRATGVRDHRHVFSSQKFPLLLIVSN